MKKFQLSFQARKINAIGIVYKKQQIIFTQSLNI